VSQSVLPFVSERDYPRFQQIIPELAATSYEEWSDDHAKAVAYRRSRNGVREVPVLPDEFDIWLRNSKQSPHLELLWEFAESKA
jgi:hypothetical protein